MKLLSMNLIFEYELIFVILSKLDKVVTTAHFDSISIKVNEWALQMHP